VSAYIVVKQPSTNSIHLLSDGLASGKGIALQHPKTFPIPHLNAVVGIRGGLCHFGLLSALALAATTFDGLAAQLETIARGFAEHAEPAFPAIHPRGFEVVLAGLSESLGLTAYLVSVHGPAAPYTLHSLPNPVTAVPGTCGAQEAVEAVLGDPNRCDIRAVGHAAMGEIRQRALAIKPEWGEWVGGHTMLTSLVVDTDGPYIVSEILGTWPMPAAAAA
jgi:hypothetical protein